MLELSKLHMYDFHYNHMKVKYPRTNQLRLLFTDTDSLACVVQTDDIYKDMASDAADRYDFSEYPFDHPLYHASNRKAILCQCKNLLGYDRNVMPFFALVQWIRMCFHILDPWRRRQRKV